MCDMVKTARARYRAGARKTEHVVESLPAHSLPLDSCRLLFLLGEGLLSSTDPMLLFGPG